MPEAICRRASYNSKSLKVSENPSDEGKPTRSGHEVPSPQLDRHKDCPYTLDKSSARSGCCRPVFCGGCHQLQHLLLVLSWLL
jgi:hypothetical protein